MSVEETAVLPDPSTYSDAMYKMAFAWVDRWEALGGHFGMIYDKDHNPDAVTLGMVLALEYWKPTDEGREDIRPHTWLTEKAHHAGAVKALEGLLELVPDLRETVREIAKAEVWPKPDPDAAS